MPKDLQNAKTLAAMLEEESAKLRQASQESSTNGTVETNGSPEQPDAPMGEDNEDPEPRERGSDAVERRIEKIMADLREQGGLDFNDEKAVEDKRVRVVIGLSYY